MQISIPVSWRKLTTERQGILGKITGNKERSCNVVQRKKCEVEVKFGSQALSEAVNSCKGPYKGWN